MKFLEEVFLLNKKLDEKFNKEYNLFDEEIITKNILELLVEIGEFANETKCFKYWSKKKVNKEDLLFELADCLIMTLSFLNIKNSNIFNDETAYEDIKENNPSICFISLYKLASTLDTSLNVDILKHILNLLIHVAHLLNYNNDEIKEACLSKITRNIEKFDNL